MSAPPQNKDPRSKTSPSDEELQHLTGIGQDEEEAMEREAYNAQAEQILQAERNAAMGRAGGSQVNPRANTQLTEETEDQESNLSTVAAQERIPPNNWNTRLSGDDGKEKKVKGKSKRKKRILTALFMLVATSVIGIAAFFIFLPFKMVHLMENLQESASHLVERPVEQRMTYLVTRYLAGKIVAGDNANEFDRYICPSGGIICSVFKTWQVNRFEEKLGLTIESNRLGNGQATSWKVTHISSGVVISGQGGEFREIVSQLERSIDGTRLMRQYIKDEVKRQTRWYNVYKRYALRKMLMRKYGITSWRGPAPVERGLDSYADFKRKVRLSLKKRLSLASLGRVIKNTGKYVACLAGDSGRDCKNLQTDETPPPAQPEKPQTPGEQAASEGRNDLETASSEIDVEEVIDEASQTGGTPDQVAEEARKILTRRLLASGIAGIGIIDLLAQIVEKIDQGAVNAIAENKNELAYIGYASELRTAIHKMKEGDLDPENVQAIGEIFNNYEKSPLAQHEMGTAKELGQPGHEVRRDCDDDGAVEKLAPRQFVCPNMQIVYDVTAMITNWPPWDSVIVPMANAWNHSVGAVLDFFGDIAGGILDAIGFTALVDWVVSITGLGELAANVLGSVVNTFFGSPISGAEEEDEAYDGLSIGMKAMFNGMMKNGVDQEGNGMGMGGKPLTTEEISQLHSAIAREKEESFRSQSLMARLFDANLDGSIAHTFIARMPSNLSTVIQSPLANLSTLAMPSAGAYPFRNENTANMVIYGYAEDSDIPFKPPETYTDETCAAMAKARDESYERREGEASPRYHVVDGCALEKVIRVSATAAYTDEFDEEFRLYQNQGSQPGAPAGTPGETIKKGKGFSLRDNTDYSGTACALGSRETQIYTHPKRGFKIRLCKIKGMEVASIVSEKVVNMVGEAQLRGIELNGGAFRSYEQQIETRRNNCSGDPLSESAQCSPPTAVPGNSEHERGLAIDFSDGGSISSGSPQFNWLQANAARYGYYNLPSESWHWSTSGH